MIKHPPLWAFFAFGVVGIVICARYFADLMVVWVYGGDLHLGVRDWVLVAWAFAAAVLILTIFAKLKNSSRANGDLHGSR